MCPRLCPLLLALLFLSGAQAAAAAAACVPNPFDPLYEDSTLGGCKLCSLDGSTCETCWETYGLSSAGECVACNASLTDEDGAVCSSCDGDDPGFCTDCALNIDGENNLLWFATADGTCQQCETSVEGCRACKPLEGVCDRCSYGQGLVGGTCQECADEHCSSCNGDAARCVECEAGFFVDAATGACAQCSPGCAHCDSTERCRACQPSGYVGLDGNGTCVPCASPGCTSCPTSPDVCEDCYSDEAPVGLDKAAASCKPCPAGCASCTADASSCRYCKGSNYWDASQAACVPCTDPNCEQCNGCQECPDCEGCSPDRADACYMCKAGLNEGAGGMCVATADTPDPEEEPA